MRLFLSIVTSGTEAAAVIVRADEFNRFPAEMRARLLCSTAYSRPHLILADRKSTRISFSSIEYLQISLLHWPSSAHFALEASSQSTVASLGRRHLGSHSCTHYLGFTLCTCILYLYCVVAIPHRSNDLVVIRFPGFENVTVLTKKAYVAPPFVSDGGRSV